MPRSEITVESVVRAGLNPSYEAANVDGNSIQNPPGKPARFIHVKNADASPITVTIVSPRTVDGLAVADLAVTVPNGEERMIGPFPHQTFNQPATNDVHIDYSAVTSITVGAFEVNG